MQTEYFDCESVVMMEELGVGSNEILQYARAVMPRRDVEALMRGLEDLVRAPLAPCATSGECAETTVSPVADAVSEAAV